MDTKSFLNKTKGDNSKSKKIRIVNLVCDTSSRPDLHFYKVSSKYSKDNSSYRADKKFYIKANANKICPKNNMLTHLRDIATADVQMLCNIFLILALQLMKGSSFKQVLVLKKNIWA